MDLNEEALVYHSAGRAGKTEVRATKPCQTQHDLSLAYTPGVGAVCLAVEADPDSGFTYTNRGNLVGIVTNGTAVLGLGNIGPLASKPVMEGKSVLFKRFADVDAFDIELDARDPEVLMAAVRAMEPTFGGINLEDIKAPECFDIETKLSAAMQIPVFHDDQHGTAIIVGAGLMNALEFAGKTVTDVRIVFAGAGAAAIACLRFFRLLGARPENLLLCDRSGVIYRGRDQHMNAFKEQFVVETSARTLADALQGADVFVGLSGPGLVTPAMLKTMNAHPVIFALANPDPEITPGDAREARSDAIIATGRSDYPNQINNVLGFPFIFRGALDVRARGVNEAMKMAAARALAELARTPVPNAVLEAYGIDALQFGPEYLIPKPFDPRVLLHVAPAVARAAMETGLARTPIDLTGYEAALSARMQAATAR